MIGFIGGGNMAEALIKGLLAGGMDNICVYEPQVSRREYLIKKYPSIKLIDSNVELVSMVKIVVLAVKPQVIPAVLDELMTVDLSNKTVVSIAAGIKLEFLKGRLGIKKIVRVMPNTPALVLEGMSVISVLEDFDGDMEGVQNIFSSIGKVLFMDEKSMDMVTALSGSGPAFIAYVVKAMVELAIKEGMDEGTAKVLVLQTLMGTAKLLDSGFVSDAQALIKMVASPGGTTEAGLGVLDNNAVADIIGETILEAARRSQELSIQK
ncbi:MAG: pyrroline-5-carboxylate reductase [Candidatus Magnetoovum sp. WYHC-5]|nr:pyrroline-5-carboxylate reductase [Candidatus Magnetoovum sp. WYHC-5]